MKKLIILIVIVLTACVLSPPAGIPSDAVLIKGLNDPVTVAWDYVPEVGVIDYSFDFIMCDITGGRLGTDIIIIANTAELEYNFTVAELNITDVYILGVRAVENGVPSSAIWSDMSADTAGGTFYADDNGLWIYNAPSNIGVK